MRRFTMLFMVLMFNSNFGAAAQDCLPPGQGNFEISNRSKQSIWFILLNDIYDWMPVTSLQNEKQIVENKGAGGALSAIAHSVSVASDKALGNGPHYFSDFSIFKTAILSLPQGQSYTSKGNNGKLKQDTPIEVKPDGRCAKQVRLDLASALVVYKTRPSGPVTSKIDLASSAGGVRGTMHDPTPFACFTFLNVYQDPRPVQNPATKKPGYITNAKTLFVKFDDLSPYVHPQSGSFMGKFSKDKLNESKLSLANNIVQDEITKFQCPTFQGAAPMTPEPTNPQVALGADKKKTEPKLQTAAPLKVEPTNPQVALGADKKKTEPKLQTAAPLKVEPTNPQVALGADKKKTEPKLQTAAPLKVEATNPQLLLSAKKTLTEPQQTRIRNNLQIVDQVLIDVKKEKKATTDSSKKLLEAARKVADAVKALEQSATGPVDQVLIDIDKVSKAPSSNMQALLAQAKKSALAVSQMLANPTGPAAQLSDQSTQKKLMDAAKNVATAVETMAKSAGAK